jgi:hypothetical protein
VPSCVDKRTGVIFETPWGVKFEPQNCQIPGAARHVPGFCVARTGTSRTRPHGSSGCWHCGPSASLRWRSPAKSYRPAYSVRRAPRRGPSRDWQSAATLKLFGRINIRTRTCCAPRYSRPEPARLRPRFLKQAQSGPAQVAGDYACASRALAFAGGAKLIPTWRLR